MNPEITEKKDAKSFTKDENSSILTKESRSTRRKVQRRERLTFDEQRGMLDVEKDPNYEYRWVNDHPGRIETFLRVGWEIVDRESGTEVKVTRIQDPSWRQSALSQQVGGGVIGYCMRIPKDWYNEDMNRFVNKVNMTESSLKVSIGEKNVNSKGNYGEVTIAH